MTLLLVGSTGQVGRELVSRAGIRRMTPLSHDDLDITRREAVMDAIRDAAPRCVINAAGYTAVDRAESEPDLAMAVNRDGAANLAIACEKHGIPLLHFSTDYVFDGTKGSPYTEIDTPNPINAYGVSKWCGEQAIRNLCTRHIILRTAWVFSGHGTNFVKTILRLAGERQALSVVADQHGNPTPAGVLAHAALHLADQYAQGKPIPWGTYHYAGQPATTWHAFAERIVECGHQHGKLPITIPVHPIPSRAYPLPARRPPDSRLDSTVAQSKLGLPPCAWEDALLSAVAPTKH